MNYWAIVFPCLMYLATWGTRPIALQIDRDTLD